MDSLGIVSVTGKRKQKAKTKCDRKILVEPTRIKKKKIYRNNNNNII